MRINDTLLGLIATGQLARYEFVSLDDRGLPGKSESRNTERLVLWFPNGKGVVIDSFCSGSSQNTVLQVKSFEESWEEFLGIKSQ